MMNNKDFLQKFIFENAPVRGEIVRLEAGYQQIMTQHNYPKPVRELLGEALVVATLLSSIIKFKGRLTVQYQGKGKLKLLISQSDYQFQYRGLAQWSDNPSKEELIDALKEGTLFITIDPETPGKKKYQGIVGWQGSSLAESIEGYFHSSEQIPTRIWIAVNEIKAVGLLLQVLPRETSFTYDRDWEHVIQLTDTIKPDELLHCDNQTILHRLYHQEQVRVFAPTAVTFRCTCSQEKSENALLLLGQEEAEAEIKDKQKIVVTCEFCNQQFEFDAIDIANLFKKGDQGTHQVH